MSDIDLSKAMAHFLRHNRSLPTDGCVIVSDMLKRSEFSGFTEADVERVVRTSDKRRFELIPDASTGRQKVRAAQGHTVKVNNAYMEPIQDTSRFPNVIHGTSLSAWASINATGLSRRKRQHIHFAIGLPNDPSVTSGMHRKSEIAIYINMQAAINDGYEFYRSSNDVILCSGNSEGYLPKQYFSKVVNLTTGQRIDLLAD